MSFFKTLGQTKSLPTVETNPGPTTVSYGQEGGYSQTLTQADGSAIPSPTLKAAELGEKLSKTGIGGLFGKPVVKPGAIDEKVAGPLAEMAKGSTAPAVPASMLTTGVETYSRKVRISQIPAFHWPNDLILDVMPRIDERGSAEYEPVQPLHHPGAMQKYRGSSARSWSVSGKLISRNRAEATKNLYMINMIRSWRMPFYGQGTAKTLNQYLGAPPPILELEAYGEGAIGPVKCVLKDYSWSWDNTLDYIPTDSGVAFPVILEISLSLEETWSPAEYSNFDLIAYKAGDMRASFSNVDQRKTMNNEPAIPTTGDFARADRGVQASPTTGDFARADRAQQTVTTAGDFSRLDRSQPTSASALAPVPVQSTYSGDGNVGGALAGTDIYGNSNG